MVKIGDGHKLDANTTALWRMNDSQSNVITRNTIFDVGSGARHAYQTVEADQAVVRPFGPNGEYIRVFNGSTTNHGAAGDATAVSNLIGQHTFEAFVKPAPNGGTTGGIVVAYDDSGETAATNYLTQWTILNTSGFQQVFWESGAGTNQFRTQSTGSPVPFGVWSYIAYVKSGTSVLFYLNGTLQQTIALGTVATGGTSGSWKIGTDAFPQLFFNGYIRHLKMTVGAKSGTQISDGYNHFLNSFSLPKSDGAFIHWPMDDAVDLVVDSANSVTVSGVYLTSTTSANFTKGAAPLVNDDGSSIAVVGAGSSLVSETATTHSGVEALRQTFQSAFTFEGWFKRQNSTLTSGNYAGIFSFGTNTSDASSNNNHCSVEITPTNGVRWFSEYATGSDSIATFNYTFPDRESKYHIGIRRNATISGLHTVDLFVDGLKKSTVSGINPYTGGNTQAFYLGWGAALSPFVGTIDDVRISNVARTDAEILDSYKRGIVAFDLGGSYLVSGTWSNYVGTGSGIAVNVYDKEYGVCVGSTTTSGAGHYHVYVPRNTTLHFAEAREDSNHLGRTDDGYPQ